MATDAKPTTPEHVAKNPICVALDVPTLGAAAALAEEVAPYVGMAKIGLELFCAHGPQAISVVAKTGIPVFLDLKLHDIPNTVAGAARAVADLGASVINVHASGGYEMMRAAAEAVRTSATMPKIVAVTILTSLDRGTLESLGILGEPEEAVLRLAVLARDAGLDGVVCSAREAAKVRAACGPEFLIITPGIRPSWAAGRDDQKRVLEPKDAIEAGADVLVVGRPITAASNPAEAALRLLSELR